MPSPITTGNEKLVGADKLMDNYYKQRMQESEDFLKQMQTANQQAYQNARASYMGMNNSPIEDTSQVHRYDESSPMASWGKSKYDTQELNNLTSGQLQDTRYENQSDLDRLANGYVKMFGTAASTFLSSLIGLPYGAIQAAREGRWSALWDNDVTQALGDFDNWLEENNTNYKSQKQQNSPWYDPSNLLSMNWLADDIIKNAGFMVGASASMAVGAGALGLMSKSLGLVNNVSKGAMMTNNFLSSLFSATGEGMIEARQGVEERNKLEEQRLNDALAPEYASLEEQEALAAQEYSFTGDYDTYSDRLRNIVAQKQVLDQRKEAGVQQIQESGLEMGNKILLGNQILLTAGNMIQFSKLMTGSFNNARHAAETAANHSSPFLVGAKRAGENLASGYRIFGKNLGKTYAAIKGLITEGSEEMNQQWVQSASGAAFNEEDVNDYWKSKLDPESYDDTINGLYAFGNAISKGFSESWGDIDQWEQFVVGGLTGMAGSWAPTKLFNQDKSRSIVDPRRYGDWQGGAYNEIQNFNRQYQQYEENINDLNKLLADGDFETRILDSVGHTYNEKKKGDAALDNNKKAWKDADDKQNILDIQAFARAGKLEDLRAIYNEMGKNLSDEDVEGIIKRTTQFVSQEEDKQNHFAEWGKRIAEAATPEEKQALQDEMTADKYEGKSYYSGAFVDEDGNPTLTNDQIREEIQKNAKEYQRKLDSYLESVKFVQDRTNGQLGKDQEDNLVYLHNLGKESVNRMYDIMAKERKNMPKKFLYKTDKTPEELAQQYASSDLVFTKDDNTKEGYVEVDTSLMTDAAFADFFQEEIMRGGNINPEFKETAEEKALREEEEKNLSTEEKKKRAIERATKKWNDALSKQKKDANEQRGLNIDNLIEYFADNYQKEHPRASMQETIDAYKEVWQNLVDAGELYNQAGEYFATLNDYMRNPEKILKDKAKEEEKNKKAEGEKKAKKDFAGKTAKDINQAVSNGEISQQEVDDFADMDIDDLPDDALKQAQKQAQESKKIRDKAAKVKKHLQENADKTPEGQAALGKAMAMVDAAADNAENADTLDRTSPYLSNVPIDMVDPSASDTDIEEENEKIQGMLDVAFENEKADEAAVDDIPDNVAESLTPKKFNDKETGHDSVAKADTTVVTPDKKQSPSKPPVNSNPIKKDEVDKVIEETKKLYERSNDDGTFRVCTTKYPYGASSGTYYEIAEKQYGKDSPQYKRAKALYDFLDKEGAFARLENSSKDRLKEGEPLMLMVKYLPEVFDGKAYEDAVKEHSEDEMAQAMAIIMLKNGEVLGDLPLAQYEPTYKQGNPLPDVHTLMTLQEGAFKYFANDYNKNHQTEVVLQGRLHKTDDGVIFAQDNKPLTVEIKKIIKGVVPYEKGVYNSINDVFGSVPFELGVRTKAGTVDSIATKRGVMSKKSGIVAPEVGTIGQPYVLMPTPSGERIACPIFMDMFDAESYKDTDFYKALSNVVYCLLDTTTIKDENKKKAQFQKHMSELEGLLQVTNIQGKSVIKVNNSQVTLQLQSITNPDTTYILTVDKTGNDANDAVALVRQMTGIPFNVSLEYINQKIEVGTDRLGKKTYDYNKLIGEIANINLPTDTTHSVNGRFIVSFPTLDTKTTGKKKVIPAMGIVHEVIGGRDIEFDVSSEDITAKDATTGEIIDNDDAVNLRRAQIRVKKLGDKAGDFIQINVRGGTRRYDVKNDRFVDTKKETKPASPQLPESVEEDKDLDVPTPTPKSFEPATESKEDPLDILVAWAEDKIEYKEALEKLKGTKYVVFKRGSKLLNTADHYEFTFEKEKDLGDYIVKKYPYLKVESVYKSAGVNFSGARLLVVKDIDGKEYGSPSNFLSSIVRKGSALEAIAKKPIPSGKTIEQIEDEVRKASLVNQRNQESWEAIPKDLKLKMVNEGIPLTLSYNNKTVTITWENKSKLKEELKNAKMAAKLGKLTVEEAPKPMQKDAITIERENERAARQWLAKNLPSLSSEERTQFVDKLARMGDDAGKMWGSYRNGVIQIRNNAPMGTVYHEAFHYVLDMVLSDEERRQILDIAKEEYDVNDDYTAEERLANDFRRYAIDENATGIMGRIKRWIRKIWDKITRYNKISNPTVNQLFLKINNGEMASRAATAESFDKNQQRVLREIRNVQDEKFAWRNLDSEVKRNLKNYSGITEEKYNQMSLEEKEQYVRCRG